MTTVEKVRDVHVTPSLECAHTATTESLQLEIEGMSCASCANRIERAVRKLPGVAGANVNLATAQGTIHYDPSRITTPRLLGAIRDAGYDARTEVHEFELRPSLPDVDLANLEERLMRVPGVCAVNIDPASRMLRVVRLSGPDRSRELAASLRGVIVDPDLVRDGLTSLEGGDKTTERRELRRLARDTLVAVVLALLVLTLTMLPPLIPPLARFLIDATPFTGFWRGIAAILSGFVLFGPGRRFFRPGATAVLHFAPDMNSLVALGTLVAWLYGVLVLLAPGLFPLVDRRVYFDSAAVVVAAILAGRFLEARGKERAARAMRRLASLQVTSARRRRPEDQSREEIVPVALLKPADQIVVRAGERIAADGRVVEGEARVDESMLTGEPQAVTRSVGDRVIGGTIDLDGRIVVEVTEVGAETVLAQIIRLVERAQGDKLPVQRLVDRVVRVFVPAVFVAALLSFVGWFLVTGAVAEAVIAAVAVLVVACPCAMGLATPTAIVVGTGRAAELGILFRHGEALETLVKADVFLFDKTGTLTVGRPVMIEALGPEPERALRLAAALEIASTHPLAQAIVAQARARGLEPHAAEAVRTKPGLGLEGIVDGRRVLVGSRRYLREDGVEVPDEAESPRAGRTPVHVAADGVFLGTLVFADRPRPEARAVVHALVRRGFQVGMVSGDGSAAAAKIAAELGIDIIHAGLLPDGKAQVVKDFQDAGHRVVFMGDGINDAPAMARADVGITLKGGTDLAAETADVILMRPDLTGVVTAVDGARRTRAIIRGNLFWAFFYNVLLIPVAAGVLSPLGVRLDPMLAGLAMACSSVFVLGNSLRLRRITDWRTSAEATSLEAFDLRTETS